MKNNFIKLSIHEIWPWIQKLEVKRKVVKIQQHHTYKPDYGNFNGSNHFEKQQAMKDYHVNTNKWMDIAQHFTTFPDGSIMTGRSLEKNPAGIYGQNSFAICIENLGNFDKDQMTEAQKLVIVELTAALCAKFNLKPSTTTIIYHHWYDLTTGKFNVFTRNKKTCPGKLFFGGNSTTACIKNLIPLVTERIEKQWEQ